MSNKAATPEQALAVARLLACTKAPYFRAGINSLIPRESNEIPTLAVSEDLVFHWNREFVLKLEPAELAAGIAHEVLHVLHNYWGRGRAQLGAFESAKPELVAAWMMGHDCEVNDDLQQGGWAVLKEAVYPKRYKLPDNQLAEFYFEEFKKNPPPQSACQQCIGKGSKPGEKPGRTQGEVERVIKQTAAAIQEHAASGRGNIPAGLKRWADITLKPPKVRWQDKLARICRATCDFRPGQTRYTYDRPSRRQQGAGTAPGSPLLAAMREPTARIWVAIDTSGSMGDKEGQECLSEVSGILKALGAQVTIVACDAEVNACKPIRRWQDALPLMKGGGGTRFEPVFEAAARARPKPEVIIYCTDGYGSAPSVQPAGISTIWCLIGSGAKAPVGWGSVVSVEE
jgi:predicted metal-dependent peptidase